MKNSVCMSLLWLLGMAGVNVHAMGFFDKEAKLRQTELSVAELQQLSIQSGWSNDEPDLMMFEVGNKLSGPIFCIGASFDFKDGRKRHQAFEPKLYIPPNAVRRVSVRSIEKKNVQNFGMSCLCMKAQPQGPCEKAFK
jgi:hypothetical protein